MLRLSSTFFASGSHPIDGAGFLRLQLGSAEVAAADGEAPPLTVLINELVTLSAITRADGRLPFDHRMADRPFRSLSADVSAALERLGPRLAGMVASRLVAVIDPHWSDENGGTSPWPSLFAAAEAVDEQLRSSGALVAALDDAWEAAALADARVAFESIGPRLNELLRAIAMYQGHRWQDVRHTISGHLTVKHADEEGYALGGVFEEGVAPGQLAVERLREALWEPAATRDYAVWIAALAGPGSASDLSGPSTVSGPIAVSRVVCLGDVPDWIQRVRTELTDAFATQGDVPPDVVSFGEPAHYRGMVMDTGEELWADMATPPSFVARVAVRASHGEEAIREAARALRAVYELVSPELAQSLRSDVVLWTATAGWFTSGTTARGRSLGEPFAARRAAQAVATWAEDLGAPLDAVKLDLLRARALVANRATAPEIRVMRAFASLEAIAPPGGGFDDLTRRLALRSAWAEARSLLDHLLTRTREPGFLVPADGFGWEEARTRLAAMESGLGAPDGPGWDMKLLDAIDEVLEAVHPDAALSLLARAARQHLGDPVALERALHRHASGFKRARRHRNLIVHGHRISEFVLAPTAGFLARQLGIAIDAHHDDLSGAAARWLGSLGSRPDMSRAGATLADLLDAVARSRGT